MYIFTSAGLSFCLSSESFRKHPGNQAEVTQFAYALMGFTAFVPRVLSELFRASHPDLLSVSVAGLILPFLFLGACWIPQLTWVPSSSRFFLVIP